MVSPTAATFYFYKSAKPSAGNPAEPVEPDIWLHTKASQTFSRTFSGTLSGALLNLTRLCTKASQTFCRTFGTFSGTSLNLTQRLLEGSGEKVWEALVQSQVRFNRFRRRFPEKVWEALVQRQVRFNRVPKKVPEKVPEKVEGSGSGKGSRKPWCKAKSGSTGFRRRFQKRFRSRSGRLWCRARSGSTGFRRRFRKRFQRRSESGSTGFRTRAHRSYYGLKTALAYAVGEELFKFYVTCILAFCEQLFVKFCFPFFFIWHTCTSGISFRIVCGASWSGQPRDLPRSHKYSRPGKLAI